MPVIPGRIKSGMLQPNIEKMIQFRDLHLDMRDNFASEMTYKNSDYLITLNTGILGVMSFLFLNNSLPSYLSVILILAFINIVLELIYKNIVLELNRNITDKKAKIADESIEGLVSLFDSEAESVDAFGMEIRAQKDATNQKFIDTNILLNKKGKLPKALRYISQIFLVSIFIILILYVLLEKIQIIDISSSFKVFLEGIKHMCGNIR